MSELTLTISGMHCGHCVGRVEQALAAVPGVTVGAVAIGSATVRLDPVRVDLGALREAVRGAGYEVTAPAA